MAEKKLFFLDPLALNPKQSFFSLRVQQNWNRDDLRRALRAAHFPFRDHNLSDINVFVLSQYIDYPHTPDPSKLVTYSANPTYNGISLAEFSPVEKILKRFSTVTEDDERIQMIVYVDAMASSGNIKEDNCLDLLRKYLAYARANPMPSRALELTPSPPEVLNTIQVTEDEEVPSPSVAMDVCMDNVEETAANAEDITSSYPKQSDPGEVSGGGGVLETTLLSDPIFFQSPLIKKKLLVHPDYLRIYELIDDIYSKREPQTSMFVVLTGQPGIGKTMWLDYAMYRRSQLGLPFIWSRRGKFYRFTKEGVEMADTSDFGEDLPEPHWCFIDATEASNGIPVDIGGIIRFGVFPIYATSPSQSRWNRLSKDKEFYLIVMNPWTLEEMEVVRRGVNPDMDPAEVKKRFYELGPTPRLCLEYTDFQINKFRDFRTNGIKRLDVRSLQSMINNPADPEYSLSPMIILMRRLNNNLPLHDILVEFMSQDVVRELIEEFRSRGDNAFADLRRYMTNPRKGGALDDPVFKLHDHYHFQTHIRMTLQPMKLESSRVPTQPERSDSITVDFKPTEHGVYRKGEKVEAHEHGYYSTVNPNQVAINSFFVYDGILHLLQPSAGGVDRTHSVKDGLVKFIEECLPSKFQDPDTWRVVFVIPDAIVDFSADLDLPVPGLKCFTASIPFGV